MAEIAPDDRRQLRWGVYLLLIAISAGNMTGRILAVNSVDRVALESHRIADRLQRSRQQFIEQGLEGDALRAAVEQRRAELEQHPDIQLQRPFLSANDRSRWLTMRALVEDGTYAIDHLIGEPGWDTIDMVQHADRDGRWRLYSSKPPLLPTLLAGPYWLIHKTTGATLGTHRYEIGRALLILFNVLPMIAGFVLLARLAEYHGTTDFGRLLVVAAATMGTFLTTFAVVLNNHLPGALSVLAALYATMRIWYGEQTRPRYFVVAGLFAAFAVVNELPALAFAAAVSVGLAWRFPKPTLLYYAPAAALVAVAFFGTNYLAHDSLRPPYAHRGAGELLFEVADETPRAAIAADLDRQRVGDELRQTFVRHELPLSENATVGVRQPDGRSPWKRWVVTGWSDGEEILHKYLVRHHDDRLTVHAWDDWYDYQYKRNPERDATFRQSYWLAPRGIDQGEPSPRRYALHVLVGHHGIFSLTPIWLLSLAGLGMMAAGREPNWRALAVLIGSVSLACIVFFLMRPQMDRNYGGMTSAFRWVFWLAPMWLVAMLPAADAMSGSRWKRLLAAVLLGLSVMSASYPTWNPWTMPWLRNFFEYLGWAGG